MIVKPVKGKQFFVGTTFCNVSVFQDDDFVCMTDGTELWRDYDVSYVDADADAEVTEYVFPMAYEDVAGCTLTGDIYTASDLMDGSWAVSFRLTQ